jgi:hypothetical protein
MKNNLCTRDFKKKMIEVGQATTTKSNGGDIFERSMHSKSIWFLHREFRE